MNGYWAWTPGPIIARPVYAPALVAFLGAPAAGVSVSAGGPLVGWVALGWGEPCVPWWGPVGFVRRVWWGGWGGPRVINNVVINRTTVVNVESIHVYQNASAHNAVVAVNPEHFGHGPITGNRVTKMDVGKLQPLHAGPPVQVSAASFVPTTARSAKPSEDVLRRSVVATRQPRLWSEAAPERRAQSASVPTTPAPRIVTVTRPQDSSTELSRPALGQSPIERPMTDRVTPPAPPRRDRAARPEGSPRGSPKPATPPSAQQAPQSAPTRETGKRAASITSTPEVSTGRAKSLPGEPANRLAPQRAENFSSSRPAPSGAPPSVQRPPEHAGAPRKESGNEKQPTK